MDFDDIERILELMQQHDLAEFELEREGLKLRVRKTSAGFTAMAAPVQMPAPPACAAAHAAGAAGRAAAAPATPAAADEDALELAVVKSPIVGTFYRSPEPGAPSFVEVGRPGQEGPGALHHRSDEADERDHLGVRGRDRQRLRRERQAGDLLPAIGATYCSRSHRSGGFRNRICRLASAHALLRVHRYANCDGRTAANGARHRDGTWRELMAFRAERAVPRCSPRTPIPDTGLALRDADRVSQQLA